MLLVGCGGDDVSDTSSDTSDAGVDVLDAPGDADAADASGDPVNDTGGDVFDGDPPVFDAGGTWFEQRGDFGFERRAKDGFASLGDRMSGGVCVLDADGRPPLDLFFALRPWEDEAGAHGSKLFVANAPFSYEAAPPELTADLATIEDAIGCLAFDADGDGDDDLLVTEYGGVRFFERDATGFVARPGALAIEADPQGVYASAAAGDLDQDGDLDLVISGFYRWDDERFDGVMCESIGCSNELVLLDAMPNLLLIREDDGRYVPRPDLAPDFDREEPTLAIMIADLDVDGLPDIYVGNDLGITYEDRPLSRDEDGIFRDVSIQIGLAFNEARRGVDTMSVTRGDIDGNGRLDLVSTSFEGDRTAVFLCAEDGYCEDRDIGTSATARSFRWGAALADFDRDGYIDLFEASGNILSEAETSLGRALGPQYQRPNVYQNQAGRLVAVTPSGDIGTPRAARGMAVADLDDDGDPDVILAPSEGAPTLFENVRAPSGHWLRVVLEAGAPNSRAVGAIVQVITPRQTYLREQVAGEGYLGNFDSRLLFGITDPEPVTVSVRWPNGEETIVRDVSVDQEVRLSP